MTRALVHCHQRKVLHLDVKPANVLVTEGIRKLGDFGYLVSMAKCGTPVGAKAFLVPGYQAPELLLGKSPAAAAVEQQRSSLCWATSPGIFVICCGFYVRVT